MKNLIKLSIAHKKIVAIIAITTIAIFLYGYFFPAIYNFKCEGRGFTNYSDGKESASYVTEYVSVNKYLYGFNFTLNRFKLNECNVSDDEVYCGASKNNDWLIFDLAKTQLTGVNDLSYMKKNNLVSESFWGIDCVKLKRAID